MQNHTTPMDPDLFHDLLAEAMPTIDICRKHAIALADLRRIIQSQEFRQAAEDLAAIEEIRTAARLPARREQSLAALERIIAQPATTPTHTETIRKAANTLMRDPKAAKPKPPQPTAARSQPPKPTTHPKPKPPPKPPNPPCLPLIPWSGGRPALRPAPLPRLRERCQRPR
jgi:Fic family protein